MSPLQRLQQNLIAGLAILAVVGYPLVSIVPTFTELDSRGVSVPFRGAVFVLSLIALVLGLVPIRKKVKVRVPLLLFLLCWVGLLLRYVNDVVFLDIQPSALFDATDFLIFIVGVSFIPTLPLFTSLTLPMLGRVHRVLCWLVGFVVAVYSMHFTSMSHDAEFARSQAEALNAITYGSLGAILILLTFTYPFSSRRLTLAWLARLTALGLGGYAVVSSASRGPLVALAITALSLLLSSARRHRVPRLTVLIGVTMIAALAFAFGSLTTNLADTNYLANRIAHSDTDDSTLERLYLIQSSWNIFIDNPVAGGAIVEPVTKAYPHNIVLEGLMVGGVFLGLLVLAIVTYAIRIAWLYMYVFDERKFIGALLMFSVVMAMISGSLYTGPEFWYIFAIAAASRHASLRRVPAVDPHISSLT